jgi:hypothetical protein
MRSGGGRRRARATIESTVGGIVEQLTRRLTGGGGRRGARVVIHAVAELAHRLGGERSLQQKALAIVQIAVEEAAAAALVVVSIVSRCLS